MYTHLVIFRSNKYLRYFLHVFLRQNARLQITLLGIYSACGGKKVITCHIKQRNAEL